MFTAIKHLKRTPEFVFKKKPEEGSWYLQLSFDSVMSNFILS